MSRAVGGEISTKCEDLGDADEIMRQWVQNYIASPGEENLFDACMDRFASILIGETLNATGGNRSRAAKLLGLSRPTLISKIEKYRLKFETSVSTQSP
jgi:DNA-binding protein Fis